MTNTLWNKSCLDSGYTVAEYLEFLKSVSNSIEYSDSYWQQEHFSMKTIALCPYCGLPNRVRLDLSSIKYWSASRTSIDIPKPGSKLKARYFDFCEHAAITDCFIHFNGYEPQRNPPDGKSFHSRFGPEVPGVFSPYFKADFGLKAVMTCLPLCRIEENEFVPRYKLYVLSYFLPERNPMIDLQPGQNDWRALLKGAWKRLDDTYFKVLPEATTLNGYVFENVDRELEKYVEKKLLYWMGNDDFKNIYTGDLEAFPFKGIQGRTEELNFRMHGYGGHELYKYLREKKPIK